MKKAIWLVALGCGWLAACNKDKFTTKPQVKIRSIAPSVVQNGNIINLAGSYTDSEGDIDTVFVVYKWYNNTTATFTDTLERFPFGSLGVPSNTRQAELELLYEYNTQNTGLRILSGVSRDTTATLGLILKDKAGNRSDYVESEKFRLRRP